MKGLFDRRPGIRIACAPPQLPELPLPGRRRTPPKSARVYALLGNRAFANPNDLRSARRWNSACARGGWAKARLLMDELTARAYRSRVRMTEEAAHEDLYT
jgi:hypothetical protein